MPERRKCQICRQWCAVKDEGLEGRAVFGQLYDCYVGHELATREIQGLQIEALNRDASNTRRCQACAIGYIEALQVRCCTHELQQVLIRELCQLAELEV